MYIFKVSLKQQQSNVEDDISIHLILKNPNGGKTQVINIDPATFHCCDIVSFKVAESQSMLPLGLSLCARNVMF